MFLLGEGWGEIKPSVKSQPFQMEMVYYDHGIQWKMKQLLNVQDMNIFLPKIILYK